MKQFFLRRIIQQSFYYIGFSFINTYTLHIYRICSLISLTHWHIASTSRIVYPNSWVLWQIGIRKHSLSCLLCNQMSRWTQIGIFSCTLSRMIYWVCNTTFLVTRFIFICKNAFKITIIWDWFLVSSSSLRRFVRTHNCMRNMSNLTLLVSSFPPFSWIIQYL